MKSNVISVLVTVVLLAGTACNTTIQSQTAQATSATKQAAMASSPAPEPSSPVNASSQAELRESERVADFGRQTGGKTIRVEFVSSDNSTAREKTWTDDHSGFEIKARFTAQSAWYETVWEQGTTDVYLVNAQAGQTMKVNIKAIDQKDMREAGFKQAAGIEVYNAATNEPLAGGDDDLWSGRLPEAGDYAITVVCEYGGTKYDLQIEVK